MLAAIRAGLAGAVTSAARMAPRASGACGDSMNRSASARWIAAAIAVLVGLIVYLALRARVKFCAIGVTPRHFIAIDITPRGQFLPPAHQGLSAIQFPRIIDKELTTTLHYVLGNGSLHWVRFQDLRGFPDNRNAARRIRQAVHNLVYDPNAALAVQAQQKAG